jgi:Protein of unknown function (DUF4197)
MKKSVEIITAVVFACAIVISCDKLDNAGLSDSDIVDGLKTALKVGTDSAVTITSVADGYFKDQAIKILLPPEISSSVATIIKYGSALNVDLSPLVDNVVHSMNRAAEYAADSAKPILINSITSLSITDGLSILNGTNPAAKKKSATPFDSTAATDYLRSTTYNDLVRAYKAPVDAELNKDLGLGFSTNDAWSTFSTAYNQAASAAQTILNLDVFNLLPAEEKTALQSIAPLPSETLGQYVTEKALDGLFLKVGDQERSIRRDPLKWASDAVGSILEKVFGK